MPSNPPVKLAPMFAASCSNAMVHRVSMRSASPRVRSRTEPLANPIAPATMAAAASPLSGSFQPQCVASRPTV